MQSQQHSGDALGPLLLSGAAVPDEEDVESDVLESEGASQSGSDSENTETHNDELYMNFIRSVFAAPSDENDRHSLCSGTDEDDEEYRPQQGAASREGVAGGVDLEADEQDEEEDDDDSLDNEFLTITKHELQELVDYSWRTVTGPSSPGLAGSGGGPGNEQDSQSTISSSLSSSVNLQDDLRHHKEKTMMTTLLDKMLAGKGLSGICVDGIQVDSLRRLVARQMSMSLQLLVQMLLVCDGRSSCDQECFRFLMELGNHREASLRKSSLMRMQTKNLFHFTRRFGEDGPSALDGAQYDSSDSEEDVGFHLTRSQAAGTSKGAAKRDGGALGGSSVFNIAAFADINALLVAIDSARRMKSPSGAEDPQGAEGALVETGAPSMQPPLSQQEQWKKTLLKLPERVKQVLSQFNSRTWSCLIPRPDYPLNVEAVGGMMGDSSSLLNRSRFTPAEDDLLLRGLMHVGQSQTPGSIALNSSDNLWATIRRKFLPSKDKQLLEFRYSQLINTTGSEGHKFKNYVKLMRERGKSHRKWTFDEDIDLLKGYQLYADKWHMINLFFLPHRSRRELKNRWSALLKESLKTMSDGRAPVRQNGSINNSMTSFLTSLRTRGAQAEALVYNPISHGSGRKEEEEFIASKVAGPLSSAADPQGPVRRQEAIYASVREADEDVLPDSDSDDAGSSSRPVENSSKPPTTHGPNSRKAATPLISQPPQRGPGDLPSDVQLSADTTGSIGFPNSTASGYPLLPEWLFHEGSSASILPSISRFNFPVTRAYDAHSSVSTPGNQAREARTPVQPLTSRVTDIKDSPRFLETSLGTWNFTVPHIEATLNGAEESFEDFSHHDLSLVSIPPERGSLKRQSDEGSQGLGSGTGVENSSGASLFERVTSALPRSEVKSNKRRRIDKRDGVGFS